MILHCSLNIIKNSKTHFSFDFIKKKERKIILNRYPNKLRRIHFLSYPATFQKNEKEIGKIKNGLTKKYKLHKVLFYIFSSIYIFGFVFNYSGIYLCELLLCSSLILQLFKFSMLLFIFSFFFSYKKFEKQFFKKIVTSYLFLDLALLAEKYIILSGAENTLILFKFVNSFLLNANLWIEKNNISQNLTFQCKENSLFWETKTFFLAISFLDSIIKANFFKFSKFTFDEMSCFPLFSINSFIFLEKKTCDYIMTDFWIFSNLSNSFILFIFLLLLYFSAFVKNQKAYEKSYLTIKEYFKEILQNDTNRTTSIDNPSSSISDLKSREKVEINDIEEMLNSEKKNLISGTTEKSNRWKIKKKGIRTPFPESVWNNELPILKQNLWYEIKSR